MNRALILVLSLMFGTFLLAQSSNPDFIDSPSWVLAGEGELADFPSPVAIPTPTDHSRPAASRAASKARPRTSSNEGFFHLGIYVTP